MSYTVQCAASHGWDTEIQSRAMTLHRPAITSLALVKKPNWPNLSMDNTVVTQFLLPQQKQKELVSKKCLWNDAYTFCTAAAQQLKSSQGPQLVLNVILEVVPGCHLLNQGIALVQDKNTKTSISALSYSKAPLYSGLHSTILYCSSVYLTLNAILSNICDALGK